MAASQQPGQGQDTDFAPYHLTTHLHGLALALSVRVEWSVSPILAVIVALVATFGVSWVTTIVVGLPLSFLVTGFLSIFRLEATVRRFGVYASQAFGYAGACFADLLIGSLLLRLWGVLEYQPLLIVPVAWSAISYARARFSFQTYEAEIHNRWQKGMNVLGSTMALVAIFIVTAGW